MPRRALRALVAAVACADAVALFGRVLRRGLPDPGAARRKIAELRRSIGAQKAELSALERALDLRIAEAPPPPRQSFVDGLKESAAVFRRRYLAASDPRSFVVNETSAGLRIAADLVLLPPAQRVARIATLYSAAPLLAVHAPGILARLDKLERFVPGIVERILDGGYLPAVEPELDGILDRFDDIEPHVPWVLENIDLLVPHLPALMRHIDELLLYADDEYRWADDFLPYLPFFAARLDRLGPHLPLLRPHLRRLRPHFRRLVPCVDPILLKSAQFSISANADVLLFWLGWALRIPFVVPLFVRIPGGAEIVGFLARRLPRRPVRGRCAGVECLVGEDYGSGWNRPFDGAEPRPVAF